MSESTDELVVTRDGGVMVARLNRPEARNALSPSLMAALGAAVDEAEADPDVRVVVLTGTGDRAFCAGLDLRAFAAGEVTDVSPGMYRLLEGRVAVPLIGAVNATAVAGGLEVLLGCDVIVASTEARFGLPEVKRGLFAGGGVTAIGLRVPLSVALEMTLTGETIDAARAYEVGLVNAVVPPEEVLPAALAYAERIAANAPLGLAASKELVRLGTSDAARAATRLAEWRTTVFTSEDATEGALAYVEKRPPHWLGR
jgi:enoyl-CoA hydratase